MISPNPPDRAQEFSLKMFRTIENCLSIRYVDGGIPQFIPQEVNEFSVLRLRNTLLDLERSSEADSAARAMESFGRSDKVQTVGVGFAEDFDLFVKLGLLLGQRTVLWDAVMLGHVIGPRVDLMALGRTACDLLQWKPVVEAGGLVILPHPTLWCERSHYYLSRIPNHPNITANFVGFVNVTALLDEGFILHPYSWTEDWNTLRANHGAILGNHDLFQIDRLAYHERLSKLMTNPRFAYLKKVSAGAFYNGIRKAQQQGQLHHALHNLLQARSPGLSSVEKQQALELAIAELDEGVKKQNAAVLQEASIRANQTLNNLDVFGKFAGAIGSAIKLAADPTGYAAIASAIAAMCGLPRAAATLVQPAKKDGAGILYQTFSAISLSEQEEFRRDFVRPWFMGGNDRMDQI